MMFPFILNKQKSGVCVTLWLTGYYQVGVLFGRYLCFSQFVFFENSSIISHLCLSRGLRVGGYSDVWVPWKLPWALSPGLGIGWPLTSFSIFLHCCRANRKSTCSLETFSLWLSIRTQKSAGTWRGGSDEIKTHIGEYHKRTFECITSRNYCQ